MDFDAVPFYPTTEHEEKPFFHYGIELRPPWMQHEEMNHKERVDFTYTLPDLATASSNPEPDGNNGTSPIHASTHSHPPWILATDDKALEFGRLPSPTNPGPPLPNPTIFP